MSCNYCKYCGKKATRSHSNHATGIIEDVCEKHYPHHENYIDAEKLAIFMHNTYEKSAKELGWDTQEKCKVEFEDLPEKNRQVMLFVAEEVIKFMEQFNFRSTQ